MSNDTFLKVSQDIIESYGLETVKRWSQDSNSEIATMFKKCLEVAGNG